MARAARPSAKRKRSPNGVARAAFAVATGCGKTRPSPARSPSPGASSGVSACAATKVRSASDSVHAPTRTRWATASLAAVAAQAGRRGNAVEVMSSKLDGSIQPTAVGLRPAANSAPRSLSENDEDARARRLGDERVRERVDAQAASELPAASTTLPRASTIRVAGSLRMPRGLVSPRTESLATMPLSRGSAPVNSAAWPGAVSVAA